MNQLPGFSQSNNKPGNSLLQYVKTLEPETIAQLSTPNDDVRQMIERNVIGLLGGLPSEHFDVEVTTSREQLGHLLVSAMMSGYFLRSAEQRMGLEQNILATLSMDDDSDADVNDV